MSEEEFAPVMTAPSPSRNFSTVKVFYCLVGWLLRMVWLRLTGTITLAQRAQSFKVILERLGGLWIKTGQLLSLRRDLFSEPFCRELSRMQDRAAGFSGATARMILERNLGCPLECYFEQFDERPMAAASIGQVHKAFLRHEGVWVAVKIMRPDAAVKLQRDLRFIRTIFWIISGLGVLSHMRWSDLVWELEQILNEEIDYRFEAGAIARMRKTLCRHGIYVPKVYTRYCTREVLVMELIRGVSMASFLKVLYSDPKRLVAWQVENNIDPKRLAKLLVRSMLRQLFEDNLFHGDLHPGNIYLLRNSHVALIDFGAVGHMEHDYWQKYYLLTSALAAGAYTKSIDILLTLSHTLPPTNIEKMKLELIRALRAWEVRTVTQGLPYHEKSISCATGEMVAILSKYQVSIDWSFLRVDRAQLTLDASIASLYPSINYPKMMRRYIIDARRRRIKRHLRESSVREAVSSLVAMMQMLPEATEEYITLYGGVLRRQVQSIRGAEPKLLYGTRVLLRSLAVVCFIVCAAFVLSLLNPRQDEVMHRMWFDWLARDTATDLAIAIGASLMGLVCLTLYRRFSKHYIQQDEPFHPF